MKQQILNLKKKLLLVELPEGIVAPEKSDNICIIQDIICFRTSKMKPTMRSLGKLTDITESQYQQRVEAYTSLENRFRNYTTPVYIEYLMKTAKESFFSYLESQKILFENKLGEFPTKQNTGLEYGMEYISKVQSWEEEHEKVWVLSNCYLFEIL